MMKRQIRHGVFETNSSSTHSLTVIKRNDKYTPDEILDDIYLSKRNVNGKDVYVWEIYNDEDLIFGRSPFRALRSFADKWKYACASLVSEYQDEVYKELEDVALRYIPGLNKIVMPTTTKSFPDKEDERFTDDYYVKTYGRTEDELAEYLMEKEEVWNMEIEYWKSPEGYWCFDKPFTGYVDKNILSGFLQKENISIEDFLINKKYVVIQDGDEYCYWDDMKKSGLVNMDAINYEYTEGDY